MAARLALASVLGAPAQGGECVGVGVPDSATAGGANLVLNGLRFRIPVT
jgi:hypothetical protein